MAEGIFMNFDIVGLIEVDMNASRGLGRQHTITLATGQDAPATSAIVI